MAAYIARRILLITTEQLQAAMVEGEDEDAAG